jgi:hypothetical protein
MLEDRGCSWRVLRRVTLLYAVLILSTQTSSAHDTQCEAPFSSDGQRGRS